MHPSNVAIDLGLQVLSHTWTPYIAYPNKYDHNMCLFVLGVQFFVFATQIPPTPHTLGDEELPDVDICIVMKPTVARNI